MRMSARRASIAHRQAYRLRHRSAPEWFPNWTGETVVLVASGPSASSIDLTPARERGARFIAVNDSWRLAPWADVLYACDETWWSERNGAPEFGGLKITQDARAVPKFPDLHLVMAQRGIEVLNLEPKGVIGWGGNGGFHAMNLAVQFGAGKLILVGFDMTLRHGNHWHADHTGRCGNPTDGNVDRWRRVVDGAAETLRRLGIPTFNTSPISALVNYPKTTIEAALDG